MAHDIFISYSHHDKPTADAIVAKFESEGLRCWYAPRDIAPGEDWAAAIIDGIKDSKVFVVVFTSYSNGSQQVLREIGLAVTKGMPIIPFKMTNTEPSKGMQYYLSTVHWLDAVDGQLYQNINVLGKRVRAVLGVDEEKKGEPADAAGPELSAPKQKKQPDKKKWINLVIALVILALIAVILWQMGVFGGKSTPESTKAPAAITAETPTDVPTLEPTEEPTEVPTEAPTEEPTEVPTEAPTEAPIEAPTEEPTVVPTSEPTTEPTAEPTPEPTVEPTPEPTETITEDAYTELRQMDEAKKSTIRRLIIAGDQIFYDREAEQYITEYDIVVDSGYLVERRSKTRVSYAPGTLTDLSVLDGMNSLEVLWLIDQPLASLEGIDQFKNLYEIRVCSCPELTDITSLYNLQNLQHIKLYAVPVRNLNGIEKLNKLRQIDIRGNDMEDISALAGCDYSFAASRDGLIFELDGNSRITDFSFLKSVPSFGELLICNTDASRWIHELDQSKIVTLIAVDAFRDSPESFTELVDLLKKEHREIVEIRIENNETIEDLSGLTELRRLSHVAVSGNMTKAISSLDGIYYQFELEVDGDVRKTQVPKPTAEPTPEPTVEPTPEPTVEPTPTETEETKQSEGSMAWPKTENDYPELRDMSAAKRKMITKLIIAGDRVFINFNYDDYNTINDFTSAFLYDNKNNERITTNPGTLTDLSLLEGMEKLDTLWLVDQPINSLEGIEKLTNPMEIRILGCTNLEDVSPILEVTDIRMLDLVNNHVRAIGSIGKHKKLGAIYIFEPYMEDLRGLADWDVSYAEKEEGAELRLYCPLVQDYSFLRSIPSLSSLDFAQADSSLWINELDQTKIKELKENGCVKTQEDFDKLADSLISNHPEITTLCMINNPEITDLSKLTELPNLSAVTVSEDMWAAVTSLDNVNFQFDLRLND
ncbi:MAG: TIR domain-containing protein [Clostridia bacterium]|nr:TIR domain-containing protein [Clostridia bacterium]